MTTLTKDEVRKLTPEQQEAVGIVEARRIWLRQQLLERARRYRGMNVIAGLLMGAAGGLAVFSAAMPRALPFAIIAVTALVGFHAAGLNRRLDALMQLLDDDIKKDISSGQNNDDHAG